MEKLNVTRLEQLKTLPVSISVRVCGQSLKLNELLEWAPGTILSFDQSAGSPLELKIGEQTIADGHAVKVGTKFGIRIGQVAHHDQ